MEFNDIDPKDYKYVVSRPDRSFNPAKNKALIQETITEAENYHRNQGKIIESALGERIDAVASYGCYRFNKGEKSIREYLGDKVYTHLIGEKILEKVRVMQTVNRLNGNTRFKNSILL